MDAVLFRFWIGSFAIVTLALGSCSTLQPPVGQRPTTPSDSSAPPQSPEPSPSSPVSPASPSPETVAPSGRTIAVKVYQIDNQCLNLVPQTVAVDAQRPVQAVIGKIVQAHPPDQLKLTGYDVNLKPGEAIVDFQIASDSQRHLRSLSSCEQLALFGSIEKTLTSAPAWKIQTVRFRESGQPFEY